MEHRNDAATRRQWSKPQLDRLGTVSAVHAASTKKGQLTKDNVNSNS